MTERKAQSLCFRHKQAFVENSVNDDAANLTSQRSKCRLKKEKNWRNVEYVFLCYRILIVQSQ